MISIMTDLIVEGLSPFERSDDHLTENRLLFFEVGQLFLEVIILFLLIDDSEFQTSIE